jgi:hypothetical protein
MAPAAAPAPTTATVAAAELLPKIQRRMLRGHRRPVLCLAHSSEQPPPLRRRRPRDDLLDNLDNEHAPHHHPSLLLSGLEDSTACLWDLRTRWTLLCMIVPHGPGNKHGNTEVACVAFHPSIAEGAAVANKVLLGVSYHTSVHHYAQSKSWHRI